MKNISSVFNSIPLLGNIVVLFLLSMTTFSWAQTVIHSDLPDPHFDFNTFFVTWVGNGAPRMLDYLEAARPEIVQVGFYGPMFHGYADNLKSTGYPMQLPVAGQEKSIAVQKEIIEKIHELGLKVVAHFQMVNVIEVEDEAEQDFTAFYSNHWHESLLGPKPHADVRQLLQRDAKGQVMRRKHYVDYLGICLSSPYARQMLKQMLKVPLDSGVDGIVTNYNYHWGCVCDYCQASFRRYLSKHYTRLELKEKFGINHLDEYHFQRIPGNIPGYPDVKESTELDWAAARWAAVNFKEAYDEILIDYGRTIKNDLILATWNHLGKLSITEERTFLPIELWGKGENYFWYSGGYGPTRLSEHVAGDGWLNCLYIRELSGGKRFMLGKYEAGRMRSSIAEGVATGGGGMGLYMRVEHPAAYEVASTYTRFLHQHRDLYRGMTPYAEVALVLPRQAVMTGHPEAMDMFRTVGEALIDRHVLIDVIADQRLSSERLAGHHAVVVPLPQAFSKVRLQMLLQYVKDGGNLIVIGEGLYNESGRTAWQEKSWLKPPISDKVKQRVTLLGDDVATLIQSVDELGGSVISRFEGPWTIRVSTFARKDRLILHFVNFNRDEAKVPNPSSPDEEYSIAVENMHVALALGDGGETKRIKAVTLHSPDVEKSVGLEYQEEDQQLTFRVPKIQVYAVVEVNLARPLKQ